MNKIAPLLQVLLAGLSASVVTSILIWIFTETGIFIVLGIPIAAPDQLGGWILWRAVRGALWALLFLVPLLTASPHWIRGLLVSAGPILVLLLWRYPTGGEGWLGLEKGIMLPLAAILIWLLWGALAGLLVERFGSDGNASGDAHPPG